MQALARNLLAPGQELVFTKYFTSRVAYPADKEKRQSTFIEALETLNDFKIYYGHYQTNPQHCRKCGHTVRVPSEKMTDVNIAVEMMSDAYQGLCDVALLISADSDLSAPVRAIKELFPDKRVVVALPPQRHPAQLQRLAHAYVQIGRASIAKCVFAEKVQKADGFVLSRPAGWKQERRYANLLRITNATTTFDLFGEARKRPREAQTKVLTQVALVLATNQRAYLAACVVAGRSTQPCAPSLTIARHRTLRVT